MVEGKKRIVFVESYPHVIAGQQRTLLSLLAVAKQLNIEPMVLVPGEGIYVDRLRAEGYTVQVVPYPDSLSRYGGAVYRDGLPKRLRVLRDVVSYVWKLRQPLQDFSAEAIFCNDMRGLLTVGVAARSLMLPNVTWDKLDKPHGKLDWFQLPLVKKNPIISRPVANKYPAWQRAWYKDRIVLVPNGVDFSRFQNVSAKRIELGYRPDDVVLGIFGTVTERKGHDLLLQAFHNARERQKNLRLLVVGSWEDSEEDRRFYTQLLQQGTEGVTFLGQRNDVPELMQSIDVLVIPSRYEGLGQVTLEAMAAGKPVIGSRVGGIPETIVDGETGLLFDIDQPAQLADCLERLSNDPALRIQMGDAGRERVRVHYNRNDKMAEICRLILSVCR